jgi:hypothetical protein
VLSLLQAWSAAKARAAGGMHGSAAVTGAGAEEEDGGAYHRGSKESMPIETRHHVEGGRSRPEAFDDKRHRLLESELKYLYVALTRARVNVWIFDSGGTMQQHADAGVAAGAATPSAAPAPSAGAGAASADAQRRTADRAERRTAAFEFLQRQGVVDVVHEGASLIDAATGKNVLGEEVEGFTRSSSRSDHIEAGMAVRQQARQQRSTNLFRQAAARFAAGGSPALEAEARAEALCLEAEAVAAAGDARAAGDAGSAGGTGSGGAADAAAREGAPQPSSEGGGSGDDATRAQAAAADPGSARFLRLQAALQFLRAAGLGHEPSLAQALRLLAALREWAVAGDALMALGCAPSVQPGRRVALLRHAQGCFVKAGLADRAEEVVRLLPHGA